MESSDFVQVFRSAVRKSPVHSVFFFIGTCFSGYLQVVSLGALYPIINTITGNQNNSSKIIQFYQKIVMFLGLEPKVTNYFYILLCVAFASAAIYIVSEAQQAFFLKKIEFEERHTLVNDAVRSNWSVLRDLNHGDFINTVSREVDLYKVIIKYLFMIISSLIQITFLIIMAILIDPRISIISIILLSIGGLIFYPVMKKGSQIGHEWTDGFSNMTDCLLNTTRAFKNIKTGSLESFLIAYIKDKLFQVSYTYQKQQILAAVQSRLSEFIGFLIVTIIFFVGTGTFKIDYAKIILIIVVMIRLAPQVKSVTDSFHRAYSALPSFRRIRTIRNLCKVSRSDINMQKVPEPLNKISIRNLSYEYGNHQSILTGLSFDVKRGEFWGIKGPTGSGKTTLLDLISNIIKPTSGEILYENVPASVVDTLSLHNRIGYLTQDSFIFSGSILENIVWGNTTSKNGRLDWAIETAQLQDLIEQKGLNFHVAESGQNLSGGQKQRIAIARTLLKEFDFILMDEPTSALDTDTENGFMNAIAELKGEVGILLVTHNPRLLEICDHILRIDIGQVTIEHQPRDRHMIVK